MCFCEAKYYVIKFCRLCRTNKISCKISSINFLGGFSWRKGIAFIETIYRNGNKSENSANFIYISKFKQFRERINRARIRELPTARRDVVSVHPEFPFGRVVLGETLTATSCDT